MLPRKAIAGAMMFAALAFSAACSDSGAEARTRGESAASILSSAGDDATVDRASNESRSAGAATESLPAELSDQPLEQYRRRLLSVAFAAVSAMPLHPHIKNRSRAQQEVVLACLELDQPNRALSYLQKIENWREGLAYAHLAFDCLEKDRALDVRPFLARAAGIANDRARQAVPQAWRRDRVRAHIAQSYVLLGESENVGRFESDLEPSEQGKADLARAMLEDEADFDRRTETLGMVFENGNLDQVRNALDACVLLYRRYYPDEKRRVGFEETLMPRLRKMPRQIGIELIMDLAEAALVHDDDHHALELIDRAVEMTDEAEWLPEHRMPLAAGLSALRFRAGQEERARQEVDAAYALFDAEREKIVNIYRAGALRPIAEAYHAMGERDAARTVYRRAVEEGFVNPNSRPRAEDLSATCLSMALHGFEPDEELWARLQEIQSELGDPW